MSFRVATRRLLFTGAAALVGVGSLSSAATAAPAGDVSPCKQGGYVYYADPSTGRPFKNQGQCVSFVNAGGALGPVEQKQIVTASMIDIVDVPERDVFEFRVEASGMTPNRSARI